VGSVRILSGVFALVGASQERKKGPRSPADEGEGARVEPVLLTRTAPPRPRWIEVSRWEDLVKAAHIMGRPILRLEDGTRDPEQPLYYIPDGTQSYVLDYARKSLSVSTSGGYLVPVSSPEPPEPAPVARPAPAPSVHGARPAVREPAPAETFPASKRGPESSPVSVPLPEDEEVDQYLGPDVPDPGELERSEDVRRIEHETRENIQRVIDVLRELPASSDQLKRGKYHVEQAVTLFRAGRYGSARIELNRAAKAIQEIRPL
jgi:hypothetical protein